MCRTRHVGEYDQISLLKLGKPLEMCSVIVSRDHKVFVIITSVIVAGRHLELFVAPVGEYRQLESKYGDGEYADALVIADGGGWHLGHGLGDILGRQLAVIDRAAIVGCGRGELILVDRRRLIVALIPILALAGMFFVAVGAVMLRKTKENNG